MQETDRDRLTSKNTLWKSFTMQWWQHTTIT